MNHLRVRELTVNPCRSCGSCVTEGTCVIHDDMHLIYQAFRDCDALIMSTPTYWRNVSSQLLSVMDRQYGVEREHPLRNKAGGAIAVGRGTGGGQTIAISAIYNWMLSCGMVCVPGEMNGVTAAASEPGEILKQENRLRQARILGENVLWVATRLRG